jgi:hypothetical protein
MTSDDLPEGHVCGDCRHFERCRFLLGGGSPLSDRTTCDWSPSRFGLLPWPHDAVMIVCGGPDDARRDAMESVHRGHCRHCDREVVYDGYTMRHALRMPERRGRPVLLFCMQCAGKHDFSQVQKFEDHRGHKRRSAAAEA